MERATSEDRPKSISYMDVWNFIGPRGMRKSFLNKCKGEIRNYSNDARYECAPFDSPASGENSIFPAMSENWRFSRAIFIDIQCTASIPTRNSCGGESFICSNIIHWKFIFVSKVILLRSENIININFHVNFSSILKTIIFGIKKVV